MADGASSLRLASAPCSFGIDDVLIDQPGAPSPDDYLRSVTRLGFAGTELGLPGFLGSPSLVRERLSTSGLELAASFISQPFRSARWTRDDLPSFRTMLDTLVASTPQQAEAPMIVLCDRLDDPIRMAASTRIDRTPSAEISAGQRRAMLDNLHRAASAAADVGLQASVHPHAGSAIETAQEIEQLMDGLDPAILGLCLDTGHFCYGGADPTAVVDAHGDLIRHVHLKDCSRRVVHEVRDSGGGFREAIAAGVFCELGSGDAGIATVLGALARIGYRGWVVLEQDVKLTPGITLDDLVGRQQANLDYLASLGRWS